LKVFMTKSPSGGNPFVAAMALLLTACASPGEPELAWRTADQNATHDASQALSECNAIAQEAITPERIELTSRLNRKQAQCMNEMRLAPETKTTYVDDGFGGLKVIDEKYMAEQCSPTRADRARVDDELFSLARLPLEACMRSRGFELR
jgi:hypothetical protein